MLEEYLHRCKLLVLINNSDDEKKLKGYTCKRVCNEEGFPYVVTSFDGINIYTGSELSAYKIGKENFNIINMESLMIAYALGAFQIGA